MLKDLLEILFTTASNSFIDITVFVGAVLLFFGYFNYKEEGKIIRRIEKNKKWQPLIGALLGLTPGCGGAILVMPLYAKKSVTFGTVIATLIATSGDAAFVLLSQMPMDFVKVSAIALMVALIVGYGIDFLKIKKKHEDIECKKCDNCEKEPCEIKHIGHERGDEIAVALHCCDKGHEKSGTLGFEITHKGYIVYVLMLIIGLVLGILRLFGMPLENTTILISGAIGTGLSILVMIAGKRYFRAETHEEEEIKLTSFKEMIIHSTKEVAFIGTWVFAALLAYEVTIYFLGGEETLQNIMLSAGILSVLAGALVGAIPGCGPQIVVVSLYAKGVLPFAALVANVISQDGDAIFPLIATSKKTAVVSTLITTVVAFIVGAGFYWLG